MNSAPRNTLANAGEPSLNINPRFPSYWKDTKSLPPSWPLKVSGFSYAPFRARQTPDNLKTSPVDSIRRDLTLLGQWTDHIRCYASTGANEAICTVAESLGIKVTLGIWIGEDLDQNEIELAAGIALATSNLSVVRVIVGEHIEARDACAVILSRFTQLRALYPGRTEVGALVHMRRCGTRPEHSQPWPCQRLLYRKLWPETYSPHV
ncbi:hypothetical protein LZ023_11620 [Pseudomonas silvicola]|nr:hypothetical protein LZ023_11620 [Pseudomonas silvicola]